jgi:Mg2+-importing ATPase
LLASWLLGISVLAAVVVVALRATELSDFVALAERARLGPLAVAFALQGATYVAQGLIWSAVARAGGRVLPFRTTYELSLAKLFLDQALPSAGVSGTLLVAKSLAESGMPRSTVAAGVLVNTVSYYAAYELSLAAALVVMLAEYQVSPVVACVSVAFGAFGIALIVFVLSLGSRRFAGLRARLLRWGLARGAHELLTDVDLNLARRPVLLLQAAACQLAIFVLDAATLWALIAALGVAAPVGGVFASSVISNLLRSFGLVPGGLGTFEAASVFTLKVIGLDVSVALAATLLFRGLTFWLPMAPGIWFCRRAVRPKRSAARGPTIPQYWSRPASELFGRLGTSPLGLAASAAAARLRDHGPNTLSERPRITRLGVLLAQLRSPLLLLLFFAALVSVATGEWIDAAMVLAIVLASVAIGFRREYSAQTAVEALRARIRTTSRAWRDGALQEVPAEEIVPGDVVLLSAGSLVPADAVVLEATDCYVSEAVLTGEGFPARKLPGLHPEDAPLAKRENCVFLGTNVRSGSARCVVVATGTGTEFGAIAHRLMLRPPETEFERGIRRFGQLLTTAMLVMVLLVFGAHVLGGRPPIETLLFAIALAVGLSPELLPAILSVNLARGAELMAREGVLVRRLNAIENLGSMDVLCTDKTGTLTEGVIELEGAYDVAGERADDVLELGAINATLETGLANPLDEAVLSARRPDLAGVEKLAEVPFDFVRKRVSVIVRRASGVQLVTKGAVRNVLGQCARVGDGTPLTPERLAATMTRCERWNRYGIRVLAVATRDVAEQSEYGRDDERDLTLRGFLTFLDRPKEGVARVLGDLAALGVSVKLITGDAEPVALHVAALVGMPAGRVLTGRQLDDMHDEALWREAERTDLFVEVDPNQKERIILALKKMGHVVGFLGDGVNDAPAMHAADASLAVDRAVDVARQSADFVLLEKSLEVIRRGIEEGRRTFANTLKYVLITTSANLGNMVSMAAASLFLPFLPLLPHQILLNNLLSDIPALGIAGDSVDPELVRRPRRWDIGFIGRFMVEFGVLSSAFDFMTFGVLLYLFHATQEQFRTGWFIESLLTELVIALVVRTRRPFFRSRPGTLLLVSTAALVVVAFLIPYLPGIALLGFVPVSGATLMLLGIITLLYVLAAELTKRWFYRGST